VARKHPILPTNNQCLNELLAILANIYGICPKIDIARKFAVIAYTSSVAAFDGGSGVIPWFTSINGLGNIFTMSEPGYDAPDGSYTRRIRVFQINI
jgi:hypothetical protein